MFFSVLKYAQTYLTKHSFTDMTPTKMKEALEYLKEKQNPEEIEETEYAPKPDIDEE